MGKRVSVVLYMKSGNQIRFTAKEVSIQRPTLGGGVTSIAYEDAEPTVVGLDVSQIEGVSWEDAPGKGPVKVPRK